MKELIREEYSVLYHISLGRNSFERLENIMSKSVLKNVINKLAKEGLIKISHRDGEIYAFMETKKGSELLNSLEYKEWFEESGD